MSNRIPQLYQFINAQKTNLFNTYQVGSTVGYVPTSNRNALYRRASLNRGTMKNPKTGRCSGLCFNIIQDPTNIPQPPVPTP